MLELISSLRTENAELKKMLGVAPKTPTRGMNTVCVCHFNAPCKTHACTAHDCNCANPVPVAPKTEPKCAFFFPSRRGSAGYTCNATRGDALHDESGYLFGSHAFVAPKTENPNA